ncbi:Uncharacterized protein DAT39_015415 [Clarias magur]|uniref:Uncharacterized protein n=1 Tax=Clarias magur TaxID=1594786 RepID=A0A8J4TDC5_CLAMG|nr:Uncharacterized protein DAT39_015415 [Clarias magur]
MDRSYYLHKTKQESHEQTLCGTCTHALRVWISNNRFDFDHVKETNCVAMPVTTQHTWPADLNPGSLSDLAQSPQSKQRASRKMSRPDDGQ